MKNAAARLRWARETSGYSSAGEFARKNDLEEVAYRHHENGTRGLRPEVARRYAKLLKIDVNWLLYGDGSPRKGVDLSPSLQPIIWAPKISWVQAGKFAEGVAAVPSGDGEVPVIYHRATVFALEVRGSSMNRIATEGDTIIVDYEDRTPLDGKLYVIRQGAETTFKRYRSSNGPIRLEPDSTEPHDIIFPQSDDLVIIGRVVGVLKRL